MISSQPLTLEQAIDMALQHQQMGDLRRAEEIYRQILQIDPNHPDALQLLGTVAFLTGHHQAALELVSKAIQIAPGLAPFWYNKGIILRELGENQPAESALREALRLDPAHFDALQALAELLHRRGQYTEAREIYKHTAILRPEATEPLVNIGILSYELGQHEQAAEYYRQALSLAGHRADILNNLGLALMELGKTAEALTTYRQALELDPGLAETHNNYGYALRIQGHLDEAIQSYRRAVEISPNHAEAWNNLGTALFARGQLEDSIEAYRRAINIRPEFPMALNNLGLALQQTGLVNDGIGFHQRALELSPSLAEAHSNLALAHTRQGNFSEALNSARRALSIRRTPEFLNNLGTLLKDQGDYSGAEECYREALQLNADYVEAHFNLALLHLVRGNLADGWTEYEWRHHPARNVDDRVRLPELHQPMWRGEPLARKTILIYPEQGFGDTIQFCRYAEHLKQAGATVWLAAPPELDRLLRTLPWVDRVVSSHSEIATAQFDYWILAMSLPKHFTQTLDKIPANIPYLFTEEEKSTSWKERLHTWAGKRTLVGLVWAGRPTHTKDLRRSMQLGDFAKLVDNKLAFVSLQKGEREDEPAPKGMEILRAGAELHDFADSAAILANLDLLISVDTSVVHLAGALGKPVWMLTPHIPDWRWLLERTHSPWYPTIRLFRQPKLDDWDSVVSEIAQALRTFVRLG